jgi:cytochrome b6-f complex iron-sulfur subunit
MAEMTVNTGTMDSPSGGADDISRREFLNYAWLASLGVLTLELLAVTYLFALPRLGPGEFGGQVNLGNVNDLPGLGAAPAPFPKSKIWWVQTEAGALALYKVCTHLGCIYDWKPVDVKFICPCHGSQFERNGVYIQGPAPRSLDRFVIQAQDASGTVVATTPPDGGPVVIPDGATVIVDTGQRIKGVTHA